MGAGNVNSRLSSVSTNRRCFSSSIGLIRLIATDKSFSKSRFFSTSVAQPARGGSSTSISGLGKSCHISNTPTTLATISATRYRIDLPHCEVLSNTAWLVFRFEFPLHQRFSYLPSVLPYRYNPGGFSTDSLSVQRLR